MKSHWTYFFRWYLWNDCQPVDWYHQKNEWSGSRLFRQAIHGCHCQPCITCWTKREPENVSCPEMYQQDYLLHLEEGSLASLIRQLTEYFISLHAWHASRSRYKIITEVRRVGKSLLVSARGRLLKSFSSVFDSLSLFVGPSVTRLHVVKLIWNLPDIILTLGVMIVIFLWIMSVYALGILSLCFLQHFLCTCYISRPAL